MCDRPNKIFYLKIRLEDRFNDDVGNIIKLSVDGTDCRINEPRNPFSTKWFSHKFKGAGLRYEIALNIRTGEICWINGPFPAGKYQDPTIFKNGLNWELAEGELVHADKAYRHQPRCSTPYNQSFRYEREQSNLIRARHETVNRLFKYNQSLATPFRHPLKKHDVVFHAAAVCVQLAIRSESPIFEVDYRELTFLHHCLNHGTLDIVYRALRNHPWLVPDRFANEDGIVWRHGGVATLARGARNARGGTATRR